MLTDHKKVNHYAKILEGKTLSKFGKSPSYLTLLNGLLVEDRGDYGVYKNDYKEIMRWRVVSFISKQLEKN